MIAKPNATEPFAATKVSAAASTGPVQGAAMIPETSPIANAPARPAPPTPARRACHAGGSWSSKRPNIEAAIAARTSATKPTTHGFCAALPKAFPPSAAPTPSAEYMAAIPRTYRPESAIASRRLPALRAPKIETVIGMSGYTHGVRLVAIPPANATANARTEPSASSALHGRTREYIEEKRRGRRSLVEGGRLTGYPFSLYSTRAVHV